MTSAVFQSPDILTLIFEYVGKGSFRFVAPVCNMFHRVYKQEHGCCTFYEQAMGSISSSIGDLDSIQALESYEDKILQMEAEAEASEELLKLENTGKEKEIDLDKAIKDKSVEDALAQLKKKLAGKKKDS